MTHPHRIGSAPSRTSAFLLENRFAVLLIACTALLITAPIVNDLGRGQYLTHFRAAFAVVFVLVILSAVFAVSRSWKAGLFAVTLALPYVVTVLLLVWYEGYWLACVGDALGIMFLGYTVVLILRHVFCAKRVTGDTICASLCVYILLGVLWANVYSMLQLLDSASFYYSLADMDTPGPMRFGGERSVIALYYSFVTMSTLGYGEIVPCSSAARMAAALQAIVGQLYLAVLVARLVGTHVSQSVARVKE